MSTEKIIISDDFIRLGQALKKANLAESGASAKFAIKDGLVSVNGEVCTERGRKLKQGDMFSFDGKTVTVESHGS